MSANPENHYVGWAMRIGSWMEDEDESAKLNLWEIKHFTLFYRAKRKHSMRRARITWIIMDFL